MSRSLAPSKSTVYVSNLPFTLTNNDIHKIFEKYGKIVKVTIMKDKKTRESKGVAFVLFLNIEDAKKCATEFDGQELYGRKIRSSIAEDNGRSREFIKKRLYEDKSRCYECGENGHLSYECPKNALGYRQPPPKKKKKPKVPRQNVNYADYEDNSDSDEPDLETLSAAIKLQQDELESTTIAQSSSHDVKVKKKFRRNSYFSDEEEIIEENK